MVGISGRTKTGRSVKLHDFDDDEFIALISPEIEEEVEQQINLAAERQNPVISWDEFAGYYS